MHQVSLQLMNSQKNKTKKYAARKKTSSCLGIEPRFPASDFSMKKLHLRDVSMFRCMESRDLDRPRMQASSTHYTSTTQLILVFNVPLIAKKQKTKIHHRWESNPSFLRVGFEPTKFDFWSNLITI